MSMWKVVSDFCLRLDLPKTRPERPFVLGIIGSIGSGKSTAARLLAEQLPGSVVVSGDSARFLLKERGLPWGENVRSVIREVAEKLLRFGYAVILDGTVAEARERERIAELAAHLHVPVRYVRMGTPYALCRNRLRAKYDDPSWVSSFERFRVNTTEQMLANLEQRRALHDGLKDKNFEGFAGTLSNDGAPENLRTEVAALAPKVRASLESL